MNPSLSAVKTTPDSAAARAPSRPSDADALRWVSRVLSCLVLGLGVYAAAASILMVCRYHSPGLYADQWELVGKLMRNGGKLSLAELWAQHNEHRVPVAWICGLLDLRLFGGRNISLFAEAFLVQAAAALLLIGMFRKFGAGRGPLPTVAGLALFCAFSPLQIENFVWGFQVAFVLAALGGPAAFAGAICHSAAAAENRRWISGPLVFSFAAAFAAECGLAAGLAVWPILVLLGFVLRFPRKSQILTVAVATVAVGVYLAGYRTLPDHADPLQTIRQPWSIVKYVVTYFGYAWDGSLPSFSPLPAVSELLTGLALVFALVSAGRLCWQKGAADRLRYFLAANMLFAIVTGVLTSLGRLTFGVNQATSSRYQTISLAFWASLAAMSLVSLAAGRYRGLGTIAVQIGIVALMLAAGGRYQRMERFAKAQQITVAEGYAALASAQADQQPLTDLYPDPSVVTWHAFLRSRRLGPDASEVARQAPHVAEGR